jgi:hypothetical protein
LAYTAPEGPLTAFANIRLKTDANGYLLVTYNGAQSFGVNGIGTTSTDGLVLQNTTDATVGTQVQYSPRLRLCGTAWKTDATTGSQIDCWLIENRPAAAAGATTETLNFAASINGGAYADRFTLSNLGALTNVQSFVTVGQVVAGTYLQATTGLYPGGSASGYLQAALDGQFRFHDNGDAREILLTTTAPTIASFAGTSPAATVTAGSTAHAFRIGVGGTAPGTTGTINLPTARTGWNCWIQDQTTPLDITRQTSSTTASVGITSTIAWTANDILVGGCVAF